MLSQETLDEKYIFEEMNKLNKDIPRYGFMKVYKSKNEIEGKKRNIKIYLEPIEIPSEYSSFFNSIKENYNTGKIPELLKKNEGIIKNIMSDMNNNNNNTYYLDLPAKFWDLPIFNDEEKPDEKYYQSYYLKLGKLNNKKNLFTSSKTVLDYFNFIRGENDKYNKYNERFEFLNKKLRNNDDLNDGEILVNLYKVKNELEKGKIDRIFDPYDNNGIDDNYNNTKHDPILSCLNKMNYKIQPILDFYESKRINDIDHDIFEKFNIFDKFKEYLKSVYKIPEEDNELVHYIIGNDLTKENLLADLKTIKKCKEEQIFENWNGKYKVGYNVDNSNLYKNDNNNNNNNTYDVGGKRKSRRRVAKRKSRKSRKSNKKATKKSKKSRNSRKIRR